MTEFPTYEQMAKDVVEKALDEFLYDGKTLREWMDIIAEQKPCEDCISRVDAIAALKNLYPDMPIMDIMDARRRWQEKYSQYIKCEKEIERLPSVQPKTDVLDKIIAEIKIKYDTISWRKADYNDGWIEALEWVLDDVIDKYKQKR